MKSSLIIIIYCCLTISCQPINKKQNTISNQKQQTITRDSNQKTIIEKRENTPFTEYIVDNQNETIKLYWKSSDTLISKFSKLQNLLNHKNEALLFAMNGGMYQTDYSPLGLYIENGKVIKKINQKNGDGNFYLQPNGVFYIDKLQQGKVVTTANFKLSESIMFATQSGPMLVIDGEINSQFTENSQNLNLRNGVGILPNGQILLVMSNTTINFYNFANYFKSKGCKDALYLDGFVSRSFYPKINLKQDDGTFGVIIGVTKK